MGYYGDFQDQAEEDMCPEVVPCFLCNEAMYQTEELPEKNVCVSCTKINNYDNEREFEQKEKSRDN